MWTPLFLLVGLMSATAVIAYWSDNLGKKLGKKRVSLLGLRPKQTATLITIASSLLIMLVTFGTMLVVYKPLSDALLHYDSVRDQSVLLERQNQNLESQYETLKSQNVNFQSQNFNLQSGNQKLKSGNQKLSTQNGKLKIQRQKLSGDLQEVRNAKIEAEQEKNQAIQSAQDAKEREETAKRGEETAKRGAEVARRNLETARRNLRTVQAQLKSVQAQLKTVQASLKTAQTNLKTANMDLKAANVSLTERKKQVLEQGKQILEQGQQILEQEQIIPKLEARVKTLQASETALKSSEAALKQSVAEIREVLAESQKALGVAANALVKPSIVTARDTLSEQLIAPRLGTETVTNLLHDLMRQTRENVRRLGELNGRLGLTTSIVPRRVTLNNQQFNAGEDAQIDVIAASLAQSATPAVVRVVAARNHAIDEEEIKAEFQILPVNIAYRRDDIIATSVIDGRLGDAQIFNQLLRLLNEGERVARSEKRVIPPQGGDNKFYAEGTNERLFEALRAITLLKSSARVHLRAAEDLTTTAPVKVRFEVLPAS